MWWQIQRQCSSAAKDDFFPFGPSWHAWCTRHAHMLFHDASHELAAVGVASRVVSSTLHAACMLWGCYESSCIMCAVSTPCVQSWHCCQGHVAHGSLHHLFCFTGAWQRPGDMSLTAAENGCVRGLLVCAQWRSMCVTRMVVYCGLDQEIAAAAVAGYMLSCGQHNHTTASGSSCRLEWLA